VQYIIINKGAGMSPGKMAAQAAHAAVEGVRLSNDTQDGQRLLNLWYRGGHYTKIVLEVPDEGTMLNAVTYLRERGFKCATIIDEGLTEVDWLTATAVGTEIVDKDWPHTQATFSTFKLYRESERRRKKRWLRFGKNKEKGVVSRKRGRCGGDIR
jgi:peptidyl-tRNA hydrolase